MTEEDSGAYYSPDDDYRLGDEDDYESYDDEDYNEDDKNWDDENYENDRYTTNEKPKRPVTNTQRNEYTRIFNDFCETYISPLAEEEQDNRSIATEVLKEIRNIKLDPDLNKFPKKMFDSLPLRLKEAYNNFENLLRAIRRDKTDVYLKKPLFMAIYDLSVYCNKYQNSIGDMIIQNPCRKAKLNLLGKIEEFEREMGGGNRLSEASKKLLETCANCPHKYLS